jgi:hypothetical protein
MLRTAQLKRLAAVFGLFTPVTSQGPIPVMGESLEIESLRTAVSWPAFLRGF